MPQTQTLKSSMTALEWGMLVLLSVLWGGSFFFNGVAVRDLPPFTIVVVRVALAAITLWGLMAVLKLKMPTDLKTWQLFFGMGLLNNVLPFSLIVWGQEQIASGIASILNATTPLFAVVVAHIFTTDEKITPARLMGVLSGLCGVIIMMGEASWSAFEKSDLYAQVAILGGAFCYALAGVYGRRFKRLGLAPMAIATGQVTASSLLLFPVMLLVDQPWTLPMPSLETWAALGAVAVFSTALAYNLYFRILATAGATNLLLVTFLVPVSAILLGVSLLGEVLEVKHVVGMVLIGGGLAAIDGRLWRYCRRRVA